MAAYTIAICVIEKFRVHHLALSMLIAKIKANVTIISCMMLAICNHFNQAYTY